MINDKEALRAFNFSIFHYFNIYIFLGANQLSALSPSLYTCTCFADSKHSVGDVGIPHEKAEKHASFFIISSLNLWLSNEIRNAV